MRWEVKTIEAESCFYLATFFFEGNMNQFPVKTEAKFIAEDFKVTVPHSKGLFSNDDLSELLLVETPHGEPKLLASARIRLVNLGLEVRNLNFLLGDSF